MILLKITYWSDYACPYCYIGEARMKKAIEQVPELGEVKIEMKSFQLDPGAGEHATGDTQTRFAKKYGLTMDHAARSIEHISKMGQDEGIDFKYATTLFTNTMDAHRLTKLAESKGDPKVTDKVITALFDAYFTQNEELADRDLLCRIGVQCGLDREEVQQMLRSDRFRDEVLLDERQAAAMGVHAVPFFVIDGKYTVSGAPETEGFRRALAEIAEKNSRESIAQGSSCGPEGCRLN